MAELTSIDAVSKKDGEKVVLRGRYKAQRMGGHTLKVPDGKGGYRSVTRIAVLQLDGGFVELGDRPDAELDELDGIDVVARGTVMIPAGNDDEAIAAPDPMPTLRPITSVKAAKG